MNKHTNRLIHIEAAATIPVTCPHCAAALGMIDAHSLGQRMLWERESGEPLSIAQPADAGLSAEAGVTHGKCPSCGTALTSFWVMFERSCGGDAPDEAPRLSAALHAGSFTGWTMIEHTRGGFEVCEHLFGPVADADAGEAFARIREILPDLPRPHAVAIGH